MVFECANRRRTSSSFSPTRRPFPNLWTRQMTCASTRNREAHTLRDRVVSIEQACLKSRAIQSSSTCDLKAGELCDRAAPFVKGSCTRGRGYMTSALLLRLYVEQAHRPSPCLLAFKAKCALWLGVPLRSISVALPGIQNFSREL